MPTCFNEMRSKTLAHTCMHIHAHTQKHTQTLNRAAVVFTLQRSSVASAHPDFSMLCTRVLVCLGVCVSVLLCNRICVNLYCVSFFLCLFPQKAGVLPHCHRHAASAVFDFSQTGSDWHTHTFSRSQATRCEWVCGSAQCYCNMLSCVTHLNV